jgi:hypothetical protein
LYPNNPSVFDRGQAILLDGFARAMFIDSSAVQFFRVSMARSRAAVVL